MNLKLSQFFFAVKVRFKKPAPEIFSIKVKKVKQYPKVTYLGCIFDETFSGQSIATHVINKVNSRLRFLHRQHKFLDIPVRRLLCNVMTQPLFDYSCNAWYPNLKKNVKKNAFTSCTKYFFYKIRFYLKLGDRKSITVKELEKINWLPIHERVD